MPNPSGLGARPPVRVKPRKAIVEPDLRLRARVSWQLGSPSIELYADTMLRAAMSYQRFKNTGQITLQTWGYDIHQQAMKHSKCIFATYCRRSAWPYVVAIHDHLHDRSFQLRFRIFQSPYAELLEEHQVVATVSRSGGWRQIAAARDTPHTTLMLAIWIATVAPPVERNDQIRALT